MLAAVFLATAVTAQARPLSVPHGFPTIQAAIDAARPGDTINVAPGTYTEALVIDKRVDIRGAGVGATAIKSPAVLTPYAVHLPDGRAVTAIVRVGGGAHVTISGLTVTGPIPCGIEVSGVNVFQGATLDLSDARVTRLQADASTCAPQDAAGRGVVYGLPPHIVAGGVHGSAAYGRITNVVVDHYQHAGISLTGPADGAASRVVVENDLVAGGADIPSFQSGLDIEDGVVARVTHNTVTGNVCGGPFCGPDPLSEVQGTGINLLEAAAGTQIAGNLVARNEVGVYQVASPDCCQITGNLLSDNRYFGIVFQDGNGTAAGNTISGGQVGVGVAADAVDTTAVLRGDRVRGTTVAPIREIECCGFSATAVVLGNGDKISR